MGQHFSPHFCYIWKKENSQVGFYSTPLIRWRSDISACPDWLKLVWSRCGRFNIILMSCISITSHMQDPPLLPRLIAGVACFHWNAESLGHKIYGSSCSDMDELDHQIRSYCYSVKWIVHHRMLYSSYTTASCHEYTFMNIHIIRLTISSYI